MAADLCRLTGPPVTAVEDSRSHDSQNQVRFGQCLSRAVDHKGAAMLRLA